MKKMALLILGLTLVFALAACGSKEDKETTATPTPAAETGGTTGNTTGQNITLKASNFKFNEAEYRVKKGEAVTITLDNEQGMHGAAIKEFDVNLKKNGETITFTPDKAGSFPIICSIQCGAGHSTMKSTLIVE
ncbi:cupredoxin domain-containing protein [Paenibacillus eucommiae]|uniref:Cytochrome c oxidase subunit 2 n=1 Tax=Paenibacillus eucommiae TaxID=1355755 RepID=A0ABS4J2I4_9BACL|nr:cupredoxin domain-containing protein [Paenibacillus eucommiae]MBP1993520.1 cytochrome c oxidase subunit 2 [Paenibacillus eucommiae]